MGLETENVYFRPLQYGRALQMLLSTVSKLL